MAFAKLEPNRTAAPTIGKSPETDRLRALAERFPRALRFLGIGALGLLTDLGFFTTALAYIGQPLGARALSLALATIVTWRLNRALTFDRSGRRQSNEMMRYAVVTLVAQGTSYATFASLVLTVLSRHPQLALLVGAVTAAVISYNGHRLFAFAPLIGCAERAFHTEEPHGL